MSALEGGRISLAATCLGLAQAAFDASLAYAREREQFGQPIANFQAIQWVLADMATESAAARLLTLQAARPARHAGGLSASRAASMAKLFASEMATRAALKGLQIHGGYGYLQGLYPVERILRDARFFEIGEGTSEIQRLAIARDLLKEMRIGSSLTG